MGIRLAGGGEVREVVERFAYDVGVLDTGDLEVATKTIIATAEATGLANADYNASLTLPKPSDARLEVKRIASRLAVTIDSMTAGVLYCRAYVDAQQANNRLFDLSWTSTGAKLATVNTHSGNLATIFNLLKDGGAHTFYFYFWVNTGNAVLSACQFWEGVGADGSSGWGGTSLALAHEGLVAMQATFDRAGTGAISGWLRNSGENFDAVYEVGPASILKFKVADLLAFNPSIAVTSSVATDLVGLTRSNFVLRKEE